MRRDLLTQALTYYEGFLHDSAADPLLRAEAADAQNRAAMILNDLGDTNRAIEAARRAVALNEQLLKDHPDGPIHRYRLGGSLISLGNILRTTRRSDEAIAAYRRSAELSESIVKEQPDNLDAAANLGVAWASLSKTLGNTGKTAEAEAVLSRNRTYLEAFVARAPKLPRPRDLLANALHELGNNASDRGEFEPARDLYLQCLGVREGLVREHPDDGRFSSSWPGSRTSWDSSTSTTTARRTPCPTTKKDGPPASNSSPPSRPRPTCKSTSPGRSTTSALSTTPSANPPKRCRSSSVASSFEAASSRTRPITPRCAAALGGTLHNLAMSQEQLGRNDEAERLYREAMTHQRKALEVQPEIVLHRTFLTNHLIGLADLDRRTGKVDEAAKLAEEAAGLWSPQQADPLMRSALFLVACVESVGPGDSDEKKESRDRIGRAAVSIMNKAVDGGVRNLAFFQASPNSTRSVAATTSRRSWPGSNGCRRIANRKHAAARFDDRAKPNPVTRNAYHQCDQMYTMR